MNIELNRSPFAAGPYRTPVKPFGERLDPSPRQPTPSRRQLKRLKLAARQSARGSANA